MPLLRNARAGLLEIKRILEEVLHQLPSGSPETTRRLIERATQVYNDNRACAGAQRQASQRSRKRSAALFLEVEDLEKTVDRLFEQISRQPLSAESTASAPPASPVRQAVASPVQSVEAQPAVAAVPVNENEKAYAQVLERVTRVNLQSYVSLGQVDTIKGLREAVIQQVGRLKNQQQLPTPVLTEILLKAYHRITGALEHGQFHAFAKTLEEKPSRGMRALGVLLIALGLALITAGLLLTPITIGTSAMVAIASAEVLISGTCLAAGYGFFSCRRPSAISNTLLAIDDELLMEGTYAS